MKDPDFWMERIIRVHCGKCKEWIDEQEVEFVNIEEGMQGEDQLTFICPVCKTQHTSVRRG